MLNQSFSADNFRKIFDYQNRKGINLESKFFPEVKELSSQLKDIKVKFKELKRSRSNYSTENYEEEKNKLKLTEDKLKEKKDELLMKELENISKGVNSSKLIFELSKIDILKGEELEKPLYVIENTPTAYFATKQVQYNIKKLYQVEQSNRNEIIAQLKVLLDDTYPKVVVRADIKQFYENIPQNELFKLLNNESLLTLSSKKIIQHIIQEYKKLSGSDKGLPRGIGISAYLSEIYLKRFDQKIRSHQDILYYARYVDDIIAIFSPNPAIEDIDYQELLTKELEKLELPINDDKTESFDLKEPYEVNMYYLGYDFSFGTSNVKVSPSNKRINRYKKRLHITFDAYHKAKKLNEKRARKIFVKRLRFLTGNTRLRNNKKNALVGIYFSNSLANEPARIFDLDNELNDLKSTLSSPALLSTISNFSFKRGYEEKPFSIYSQDDFKLIVSAWKNEN